MKRWIAVFASVLLLLQLSACGSAPDAQASDLTYDLKEVGYFSNIFDEKSPDEWDAMGTYTILLEGLHTPVLVEMRGREVLAVHAYDQTVQLEGDGALFQDSTPVEISSVEGAVLVHLTWDEDVKSLLLTKERCYTFAPEGDISTRIFAQEDGTLAYRRYWGAYESSFEQWDTAPLELATGRDQFLYETGSAEILDGEVVLTAAETVTISDLYDLDAMFAEAKAQGLYPEYETADDLLAANQG